MAKVSMKAKLQPTYKEPSKYPSIVEDYCFEVPFALPFASIQQIYDEYKENALKKGITLTITPQDIYSKLEKTKQVTHRVSYSDSEKQIAEASVRDLKSSLFEAIKSIGGKQL
jgi:phenylalanyl-tRNA synthetase beta subunit